MEEQNWRGKSLSGKTGFLIKQLNFYEIFGKRIGIYVKVYNISIRKIIHEIKGKNHYSLVETRLDHFAIYYIYIYIVRYTRENILAKNPYFFPDGHFDGHFSWIMAKFSTWPLVWNTYQVNQNNVKRIGA